jgi:hypothetical protein
MQANAIVSRDGRKEEGIGGWLGWLGMGWGQVARDEVSLGVGVGDELRGWGGLFGGVMICRGGDGAKGVV